MISESERRSPKYIGNGLVSQFPFAFPSLSADDVIVYVRAPDGNAEPTTAFSADLNADQTVSPGGIVTLDVPLADGHELIILGGREYGQGTNLPDQGPFVPSNVEAALDSLAVQIQQLREQVERTARLSPFTDPSTVDDWFIDGEVATVQALVADIEARYLGGLAADPLDDPVEGTLYWNLTDGQMKVFNGLTWQPAVELVAPVSQSYTGDGSTFTFTLPQVSTTDGTLVVIDDVYQEPGESYTVSGDTLTLSSPVADQTTMVATVLGVPGTIIFVGGGGGGGGSGSGTFELDDGTVGAPSLSFTNDADTGLYRLPAGNYDAGVAGIVPILGGTGLTVSGEDVLVGFQLDIPENPTFIHFASRILATGDSDFFGTLGVVGRVSFDDILDVGGQLNAASRVQVDGVIAGATISDGGSEAGLTFGFGGADSYGIQVTDTTPSAEMRFNVRDSLRLRLTNGSTHYLGGSSFSDADDVLVAKNTPKAWAVINGNGQFTIVKAYNITGGSRISSGYYQIQFGTNMPSTNYAMVGTGVRGNESLAVGVRIADKTTAGCNIRVDVVGDNNAGDADQMTIVFYDF